MMMSHNASSEQRCAVSSTRVALSRFVVRTADQLIVFQTMTSHPGYVMLSDSASSEQRWALSSTLLALPRFVVRTADQKVGLIIHPYRVVTVSS